VSTLVRWFCGILDLVYGAVLATVVLGVLPERHAVVDALGCTSALVLITAGLALVADVPWAVRAARAASAVLLATGAVLLGGIVTSVGFLSGIYGAVGELGVAVLCVLAALAVPYLIVFPLVQLACLKTAAGPVTSAPAGRDPAP
jgi:hypothetical protein